MERAKEKRVQALFGAEEFDLLTDYAARSGKSVSAVVRETVEEHLLKELRRQQRIEAAQWLCAGGDEFPMADWEQLEAELEKTRFEGGE